LCHPSHLPYINLTFSPLPHHAHNTPPTAPPTHLLNPLPVPFPTTPPHSSHTTTHYTPYHTLTLHPLLAYRAPHLTCVCILYMPAFRDTLTHRTFAGFGRGFACPAGTPQPACLPPTRAFDSTLRAFPHGSHNACILRYTPRLPYCASRHVYSDRHTTCAAVYTVSFWGRPHAWFDTTPHSTLHAALRRYHGTRHTGLLPRLRFCPSAAPSTATALCWVPPRTTTLHLQDTALPHTPPSTAFPQHTLHTCSPLLPAPHTFPLPTYPPPQALPAVPPLFPYTQQSTPTDRIQTTLSFGTGLFGHSPSPHHILTAHPYSVTFIHTPSPPLPAPGQDTHLLWDMQAGPRTHLHSPTAPPPPPTARVLRCNHYWAVPFFAFPAGLLRRRGHFNGRYCLRLPPSTT